MRRVLGVVLFLLSVATVNSSAASSQSIAELYSRRLTAVPITVGDVVNHSDDPAVSVDDFKKALKDKLAARRQPRFSVVDNEAAAELVLSVEIVESIFSEHDPVDMIIGIGGTAMDAVKVEHYTRLTALYTLRDAKSGRVLWTDKLKATITDAVMTRDESRPKVTARAAEIFIREAFGKKRR